MCLMIHSDEEPSFTTALYSVALGFLLKLNWVVPESKTI